MPDYYHADHLGTPRLITNSRHERVAQPNYYPFGEEVTTTGNQQTIDDKKFTGHQRDTLGTPGVADDIDYMHARFYSPLLGRFLSTDPVLGMQQNPQSWNRYSYAHGNPVNYLDANGETPLAVVGAGVGAAFGALGSIGAQLYQGTELNWQDVGAAAAGGFVAGGLAGLTLGASALAEAGLATVATVNGVSSVVGGAVTRSLDSSDSSSALDPKAAGLDCGTSALGAGIGFRVNSDFQSRAAAATLQAERSVAAAASGSFSAARVVASHTAIAQSLTSRAPMVSAISGASVSTSISTIVPLLPSHRPSTVSQEELDKALNARAHGNFLPRSVDKGVR
ncbi:MAG: RHS repeat-associated core domain-containing protein [Holophagales bacterium]|nr:MAG: RHS repeat-associated core domain-containing protein [Holophagales bacterium]